MITYEDSAEKAAEVYFDDTIQDFTDLGLYAPKERHYKITYFYQLPNLMRAVYKLGNQSLNGVGLESPRTNIGAIVKGLMESCVQFDSKPPFAVCEEAEPYLVCTLSKASDPTRFSPIIVTENGEPVAIVKSEGEKSVFALRDNAKVNLHANTITNHPWLSNDIHILGPSEGAWAVDVDHLEHPFGPPIRLSAFAIPPEHRAQLHGKSWSRLLVPNDYSYDSIITNAQQLANDATVLDKL